MTRTFLFFVVFLLFSTILEAQVVKGRVIDDDTAEGLPFANVVVPGTTTGVSTDLDGYFEFDVKGGKQIEASAIGYESRTKDIVEGQELNFRLDPAALEIQEIVVVAGENPAHRIIRGIINNKDELRMTSEAAFQREQYRKIELDLADIDPKMQDRKILKPFKFIFDNIDSTSDERPFLPAYLMEEVADEYYVNGNNNRIKRIPRARKVSGVDNQTVVDFISTMYDEYDIYDNYIKVLSKNFSSPFANKPFFFYEYYLEDSVIQDNRKHYRIRFKPKRKGDHAFTGECIVRDSTWEVTRVNMKLGRDADVNLVRRVTIFEEWQATDSGRYVPWTRKMLIDFDILKSKNDAGLIGRKTETFRDYLFAKDDLKSISSAYSSLDERDPDVVNALAKETDDAFWAETRHVELTETEKVVYQLVDSIKNVPIAQTYSKIVRVLATNHVQVGKIEFGPIFETLTFNNVEGARVEFGMRTTSKLSDKFRVGGSVAYGFKDKEIKFAGEGIYKFSDYPRSTVGLSYTDDIDVTSESSEESVGETSIFAGLYRRPVPQKLLRKREIKAFYQKDWVKGIGNKVTVINRRLDPYSYVDGAQGFNYKYYPNPSILDEFDSVATTTEIVVSARYAPGVKQYRGTFVQSDLSSDQRPIIELSYTAGLPNILNSEYTYHKFRLYATQWFNIGPLGWSRYHFEAGKIFGEAPFLFLEVHPGSETYFMQFDAFNTINRYEFASDTWVSLQYTHHFNGFFLNKVPLVRKLKWRTVVSAKAMYGTLSSQNRASNRGNLFGAPGNTTETFIGFRAPDREPLVEVGFGIENIIKVFRVDFLWRLNYLDNPEVTRFNPRLGVDFNF